MPCVRPSSQKYLKASAVSKARLKRDLYDAKMKTNYVLFSPSSFYYTLYDTQYCA